MLQSESRFSVADNSGAKEVLCIKVLGGSKRKYARVGSTIRCVVKSASPKGSVSKGDVVLCVVVRSKSDINRVDGTVLSYDVNSVVIIDKNGNPIGTRVFGPISHELRKSNHMKIISLADYVI
jgi:large subunit ribosomal protein L14